MECRFEPGSGYQRGAVMDEDVDNLASELMYEAHNNQMVDGSFTEAGKLMVTAATVLRMLGLREEKYIEALSSIEHTTMKALRNERS